MTMIKSKSQKEKECLDQMMKTKEENYGELKLATLSNFGCWGEGFRNFLGVILDTLHSLIPKCMYEIRLEV